MAVATRCVAWQLVSAGLIEGVYLYMCIRNSFLKEQTDGGDKSDDTLHFLQCNACAWAPGVLQARGRVAPGVSFSSIINWGGSSEECFTLMLKNCALSQLL